ncbi:transposase (putative), gypsy type [Artemisia annua]|uniref:Transposase (Putative), gypsy type n=1 Tax=Artemisia annua TaxID=35608 RepID=A0A2U1PLC5_ARTAN|nr:transposase (putative), gypsy type [Artemisia annua]
MSESNSNHDAEDSAAPHDQEDAGETSNFPKCDMHLKTSILTPAKVSWIAKHYGIPSELNPRPAPADTTVMDAPSGPIVLYHHFFKQGGFRIPTSTFFLRLLKYFGVHITQLVLIGINRATIFEIYCRALGFEPTVVLFRVFYKLCKQGHWFSFQSRGGKNFKSCLKEIKPGLKNWKTQFFLVDRRAIPIAMPWRHLDSDVSDPARASGTYDEVVTMSELLRFPNLDGIKVSAGAPLAEGEKHVTHTSEPAKTLKDVPAKSKLMKKAEQPCDKVIIARKKKEEATARKAAAGEGGKQKRATGEGGSSRTVKKKNVEHMSSPERSSNHVSSPNPISRADPLNILTDAPHAEDANAERLVSLRHQEDEFESPLFDENVNLDDAARHDNEGAQNNVSIIPIPSHTTMPSVRASQAPRRSFTHSSGHMDEAERAPVGHYGELPFTPQWGLTDSSRMNNAANCQDLLANLFTPADYAYYNEGVPYHGALKRSWHQLGTCVQTQANMLLRFEELSDRYANISHIHESCKDVQFRYSGCQKELAEARVAKDAERARADRLKRKRNS